MPPRVRWILDFDSIDSFVWIAFRVQFFWFGVFVVITEKQVTTLEEEEKNGRDRDGGP